MRHAAWLSTGLLLTLACAGAPRPVDAERPAAALWFPTSGSPQAQVHFVRGVALLHSFGYAAARAEFREAQELDPDFALAYWGESLSYNHPLQPERDPHSPRAALQRLAVTREQRLAKAPTPRERGFLAAAEALWMGAEDERTRRILHRDAMQRLHEEYPRDPEVTAFYALALLAAIGPLGDDSYRIAMQAGALSLGLLAENPSHAGAAHYAIHAFDDPIHAPLALPAARRLEAIAADVSHALHMPSHIFIQRGMWADALRSNTAGYASAEREWVPGQPPGDLLHAADWAHYSSLQLGDVAGAERWLAAACEVARKSGSRDDALRSVALMKARQMVETGTWTLEPLGESPSESEALALGLGALEAGRLDLAQSARRALEKLAARTDASSATFSRGSKPAQVALLELDAALTLRSDADAALRSLDEAVRIAESMGAPRGPAIPVKPAHELRGDVLLQLGRLEDAASSYRASLLRTPRRPASLLGLGRALSRLGNHLEASAAYRTLLEVRSASPDSNDAREARTYLAGADPSPLPH